MSVSIKTKLLLSGLICALLAALAGGIGIWSLHRVHNTFEKTTFSVRESITIQNQKLIEAITLRDTAYNIEDAKTLTELEKYLPDLVQIHEKSIGSENKIQQTFTELNLDLFINKHNLFLTQEQIEKQKLTNKKTLIRLNSKAYNIIDTIEFDAVMSMDNASSRVINDIEDTIAASSNRIIHTIKAVYAIQENCMEIQELFPYPQPVIMDPAVKEEIFELYDNSILRLSLLPETKDKEQIHNLFLALKKVIGESGEYRVFEKIIMQIIKAATDLRYHTEMGSLEDLENSKLKILHSFKNMSDITNKAFESLKASLTVSIGCKEVSSLIKDIFSNNDPDLIILLKNKVYQTLEAIRQNLDELPDSSEFLQIRKDLAAFESSVQGIVQSSLHRIDHHKRIENVNEKINTYLRQMHESTLEQTDRQMENAASELGRSHEMVGQLQKIGFFIVVAAVVLVFFIAFAVSHTVSKQLYKLNKGIDIITSGNLDHIVNTGTNDEIGLLSRAFDNMTHTLKTQMDEISKARNDAEQASVAKSEFLANMSHEIRTPMNGVMGMLDILEGTSLESEQKDFVNLAKISADNLLGLINDILDFSKIEAGKLDIEKIDFNLRSTLENLSDVLAIKAYEKQIELACLIEENVPTHLNGDPTRLRQIINNLCGNAIKFVKKGSVSIHVSVEEEADDEVMLLFEIIDTGIGIPEEKLTTLFDSFTQVDASTTRKYGGTGLGLAISKQLAELMGGRIGVESQEGKGSTFWFTIDFGKQERPEKTPIPKDVDLDGIKILIVDDNDINHKVFSEYLKSWGCRFASAIDGQDALLELRAAQSMEDPFEIVLMDMQMPDMSGMETGKIIKNDPELDKTHIVIVSSVAQRGDAASFKQEGFSGFLTKPLKKRQIFDCLRAVKGTPEDVLNAPDQPIISQYTFEDSVADVDVEKAEEFNILLVEDNKINQKVVTGFLKKAGHPLAIANNGLEAVEMFEKQTFDMILMDNQMPVMGGIEATQKIREIESSKGSHTPIIALTANAMVGDRERFLEAGMDDYVSKPLKKKKLYELLEKYNPSNKS